MAWLFQGMLLSCGVEEVFKISDQHRDFTVELFQRWRFLEVTGLLQGFRLLEVPQKNYYNDNP